MKAFIFNSGKGSRLGELTATQPKALVSLGNGETLLSRQLRLLGEVGIREAVITIGYLGERIREAVRPFEALGWHFEFVENPHYATSNAIVSMYEAREWLRNDEYIIFHGDLVFDAAWLDRVMAYSGVNVAATDATRPLNTKDFKARVQNGRVTEIAVDLFDDDCVNFMPFYRLNAQALDTWLAAVIAFCERGETDVYAEMAANTVMDVLDLVALPYTGVMMLEVDTPVDLALAQSLVGCMN